MWCIIITILFLFSPRNVKAAIILNEISPRTDPEWVELYNSGPDTVDLTNWYLIDKVENKEVLNSLGTVAPETYVVFSRIKGWLNDTSDDLYLYSNNNELIDSVSYPSINEGKSVARIPNITGNWLTNQEPTKGFSNSIILSPSPSPNPSTSPSVAPSPQVAQVPSPSPSLSPSPSPSPTPTPTPSPAPSRAPSPSKTPLAELASSPEGTIAGAAIEIDLTPYGSPPASSASPISHPPSLSLNKSRAKTALIFGSGLLLLSLSGYYFTRHSPKNQLKSGSEE